MKMLLNWGRRRHLKLLQAVTCDEIAGKIRLINESIERLNKCYVRDADCGNTTISTEVKRLSNIKATLNVLLERKRLLEKMGGIE